jgi:HD-GYP domain-containing protein (c-di-GMP phosphodiesterase class II)
MTAVYLTDNDGRNFRMASAFGVPDGFKERSHPLPREIFDRYLKEYGPAAVIPDIRSLSDLPDQKLYEEYDISTVVCVGLFRREMVLGILVAGVAGREKGWSDDDFILLKAIGDQAALAIANARLYDSSQQRLEQVQALRNIDVAIASSLDLKLTLNVVLEQVIGQLRVDAAAILLLNPHTRLLQYGAGRGFRTKGIERTKLRIGEGHAGRVALERASVIIPDVSAVMTDEVFARKKLLAPEEIVFYAATPLIAKGNVGGVIEVYHRTPLEPDHEWREFLETLAGQASIAIDNSILFADLQRSNVDLSMAYDATIEGWAMALDLRDKETEGHSRRVTEMAEQTARAMDFRGADLVHVRRGALLHDLGKLGVPDGILLKPGPLTEEEWVIMRRHPQLAFDLLSPIAYLRPALDIPYGHHEKLDGTGYPRGLKGEQIPLAARIFAMVDVWDALRSDRPYRASLPPEKCRSIIEADTGRHFDPRVTEAFFKVIEGEQE